MAEAIPVRVLDVIHETDEAHSLVLDASFSYRPGQFLTVRIPHSDGSGDDGAGGRGGSGAGDGVARCYSLCSSPFSGEPPTITVKRIADGRGSNWICDNVRAGMTLDVLPPSGTFTPRSFDHDLLLFAGGSGITPVMSIIKSALARGSGKLHLVYANRDETSVIFASTLRQLAAEHPDRLVVQHWLESVQGLPSEAAIAALAKPFVAYDAFVCGPGAFMDVATHALRGLGIPRTRIFVERFVSLVDDPFASRAPAAAPDAEPSTVEVDLDGQTHHVAWPRTSKLLDVMLDAGLDAPFSCRQGVCSACAC
ncbi:MAG: 2Fe-2S iron-sulfur cluster binding domain-containing protein, partial [Micromonosporaceae bacterium]|nr:2Fe-2S iron-sulfur cluster binding domain-containing protein [Micromonosporaceae bacterium]